MGYTFAMTKNLLVLIEFFGTQGLMTFKNSENNNLRRGSAVHYPVIPDKYLTDVRPGIFGNNSSHFRK